MDRKEGRKGWEVNKEKYREKERKKRKTEQNT